MDILFFLILFFIMIPTAYAAAIGAPPAFTDKSLIEEIIRISGLKRGETFCELGTGTGRVIAAVSKRKDIKVIGFELSPPLYFITLLKLKLSRQKNHKMLFKNFFNANLKEADVIFCFLMPKTLEKLKKKFSNELKPGTRIISYVFKIESWKPYFVLKKENKAAVYFYKI